MNTFNSFTMTIIAAFLSILCTLGLSTSGCQNTEKHLVFDMPAPWVQEQGSSLFHLGNVTVFVYMMDHQPGWHVDTEEGVRAYAKASYPEDHEGNSEDPDSRSYYEERMISGKKVFIGRSQGHQFGNVDLPIEYGTNAFIPLEGHMIRIDFTDDVNKYPDAFNHLVRSLKFE